MDVVKQISQDKVSLYLQPEQIIIINKTKNIRIADGQIKRVAVMVCNIDVLTYSDWIIKMLRLIHGA